MSFQKFTARILYVSLGRFRVHFSGFPISNYRSLFIKLINSIESDLLLLLDIIS